MCNNDTVYGGDLLSAQCDAKSYRKDGSVLNGLGTVFLATIVDAKDFVARLEASFCKELWPAFCSELAKSRSRARELELYAERCRGELREMERLDAGKTAEFRTKLEQEKTKLNAGFERSQMILCQEGETERKRLHDELQEFVEENKTIQQRVEGLLEEKINQEKQLASLADQVLKLEEEAKIASVKELHLRDENERLKRLRAGSETSLRGRGLTFKQYEVLQSNKSSTASRAMEPVGDVDRRNWQVSDDKEPVQFVSGLEARASPQKRNDQGYQLSKSMACDSDSKKQSPARAPADVKVDSSVGRGTCNIFREFDPSESNGQNGLAKDSNFARNFDAVGFQRAHREAYPSYKIVDPSVAVGCGIQKANSAVDELPLVPEKVLSNPVNSVQDCIDSDETVMDEVPDSDCDIPEEPPVICEPVEELARKCASASGEQSKPLQSGKGMDKGTLSAAGEFEKGDKVVEWMEASRASSPGKTLSNVFSKKIVSLQRAKIPRAQTWRQTRSRGGPCEADPHDSFLATPRMQALAQLAVAGGQAVTGSKKSGPQSLATKPPVAPTPPRNEKIAAKSLQPTKGEKAAAAPKYSQAKLNLGTVASAVSRGQDMKEGKAPASGAPAYKFNEPVRNKRQREDLPATDCKMCGKFYDAVRDGNGCSCEHREAVSRHRYQNLPPATPDGFWNIGFESDL